MLRNDHEAVPTTKAGSVSDSLRKKLASKVDRISYHRNFPNLPLAKYVRARQLDLYESIRLRKKIYLDINFWIDLRETDLGRSTSSTTTELLRMLREGVSAGALVCPICESTFAELMKQSDDVTRFATAKLIDELSLGVALIDYFTRENTELACLLHTDLPEESRFRCDQLVWTRVAYILGPVHPSNTPFDSSTELAMQKAFVDVMWDISLSDMVGQLDLASRPAESFDKLADSLNAQNEEHAEELLSFQQTYEIESLGAIDHLLPVAEQIMMKRFNDKTGSSIAPSKEDSENARGTLTQLLIAALNADGTRTELRTTRISTALHAYIRWNKGQRWHANHFHDLHHAAAAVGYCDLFLTERGLRGWLMNGLLKLDQLYGCEVVRTSTAALTFLREKGTSSGTV